MCSLLLEATITKIYAKKMKSRYKKRHLSKKCYENLSSTPSLLLETIRRRYSATCSKKFAKEKENWKRKSFWVIMLFLEKNFLVGKVISLSLGVRSAEKRDYNYKLYTQHLFKFYLVKEGYKLLITTNNKNWKNSPIRTYTCILKWAKNKSEPILRQKSNVSYFGDR